jgi:hypothetical protein
MHPRKESNDEGWIYLAYKKAKQRDILNNFQVPKNSGNFLSR